LAKTESFIRDTSNIVANIKTWLKKHEDEKDINNR